MKRTRQQVVDVLQMAGLRELADEAQRDLPEEVDEEQVSQWAASHGINLGELVSRMGGSP